LSNPGIRAEIQRETAGAMVHQWSDIFISGVGGDLNINAVGKSVEELSTELGEAPFDVVFRLLIEEHCAVNMLQFNQSEPNLRANLTHPLSIVISDGFYVKGKPHPRLHGTFPELLGNISRGKGWLSLPDAIYKVTGAPAERFGVQKRGLLRPGYFADLTVFDPAKIASNSTYKQPDRDPVGITAVFRQGRVLFNDLQPP
jgi:N-acyl-D-aspartate/D-glutamate deacylase